MSWFNVTFAFCTQTCT